MHHDCALVEIKLEGRIKCKWWKMFLLQLHEYCIEGRFRQISVETIMST
jgi:hypothetical protein